MTQNTLQNLESKELKKHLSKILNLKIGVRFIKDGTLKNRYYIYTKYNSGLLITEEHIELLKSLGFKNHQNMELTKFSANGGTGLFIYNPFN